MAEPREEIVEGDGEDEEEEESEEDDNIEVELAIDSIEDNPILPWLTLTKEQKTDLFHAFTALDQSGEGLIAAENFKIAIKALGYEISTEEFRAMMESVGETRTGKLSLTDFITLIKRKITEKDCEDDIIKSFLHFDVEENDVLTIENMRSVADMLGDDLNDEEILEMFEAADEDEDGYITRDEFIKMTNKCVTLVTP